MAGSIHATGTVIDGFNNVGPHELAHLFNEWFGGTLSAACLHGMANAFLVYKGSKTVAAATEATILSTTLSAPALAAAKGTAWLLSKTNILLLSGHPVVAAIAAGMLARVVAKKWYASRESTNVAIQRETEHTEMLTRALSAVH